MVAKRFFRWNVYSGLALALLLLAFCYYVVPWTPVGVSQLAAYSASSDKTEFAVMRTFTGSTDPYIVRFYVHRPGEAGWKVYFLENQDIYWRGRLVVDERAKQVAIWRYGAVVARYDWEHGVMVYAGTRRAAMEPHAMARDPYDTIDIR
jgi:hypothetical protein